MSPVKTTHFTAQVAEAIRGSVEAICGAHDGYIVPHQAANLVPVVIDDNQLIRRSGIGILPRWDIRCLWGRFVGWVQAEHFLQ